MVLFGWQLQRLRLGGLIDRHDIVEIENAHRRLRTAVHDVLKDSGWMSAPETWPGATWVHNDCHLNNWRYRQGDPALVRLLDFEWATHGPPDIDAFHLVRSFDALATWRGHPDTAYSPAIVEGLRPLLAPDRPFDRLRFFALLWAVRSAGWVGDARWARELPMAPLTWYAAHSLAVIRTILSGTSYVDHLERAVQSLTATGRGHIHADWRHPIARERGGKPGGTAEPRAVLS